MNDPFHNTPFRLSIAVTTDASGDFTKTTTEKVSGRFVQWVFEPASADSLDVNWDLDVTSSNGAVLVNEDNIVATAVTRAIAQIAYDNTGTAVTYDGTNEIYYHGVVVSDETLTVTVADGGNAQSGTIHLYFLPN